MNLYTIFITVFIIILNLIVIVSTNFSCFEQPWNNRCKFGTLTPYRYIANYNDDEIKFPGMKNILLFMLIICAFIMFFYYFNLIGCVVNKTWLYVRHGTSYPLEKTIVKIISDLPKIRDKIVHNYYLTKTQLTSRQIKLFRNWRPIVSIEDFSKLTKIGASELFELAQRFQSRFPTLLTKEFNNDTFQVIALIKNKNNLNNYSVINVYYYS